MKQKTNKKMLILSTFGIILVVLGHTGYPISLASELFPYYSFHMALFIFISGYFYNESNENKLLGKDGYIVKKIKKLVIPYFIWNLVYGIIGMILRDFEKRQISIKHNIYDKPGDENGRWYIGSTKTTTGTRVIPISDPLLKALKNYKQKQIYNKKVYNKSYHYYHIEDVKNEKGKIIERRIVENKNNVLSISGANFVFTKPNGKFVGSDIIKYPFKVIHKELGLENIRFYDLRGSFATKSLRNGVEIKDVAELLEHKNIETTENYYVSSSEDNKVKATNIFANIIQSNTINKVVNFED